MNTATVMTPITIMSKPIQKVSEPNVSHTVIMIPINEMITPIRIPMTDFIMNLACCSLRNTFVI